MTENPQGEIRIGNAERDEAVRLLRQQADAGRLDTSELSDRAARARTARTREELQPLFADLPVDLPAVETAAFAPYPGADPYGSNDPYRDQGPYGVVGGDHAQVVSADAEDKAAAVPADDRPQTSPAVQRVGRVVIALLWPAALILNFAFGWHLWWLFLIPVFATGWIAYAFGLGGRPGEGSRDEWRRNRWDRRHGDHG